MNPQDREWNQLFKEVMKTTSQRKGVNSMNHENLVHKFIPMQTAMKIPDAKAAVEKEWDKVVKSKKEVILEAKKNKSKVHYASVMVLCHFRNAELEPKFQKYKGRIVLRGEILKHMQSSLKKHHR